MNDPELSIEQMVKYNLLTDKTKMIGKRKQVNGYDGELDTIPTQRFVVAQAPKG